MDGARRVSAPGDDPVEWEVDGTGPVVVRLVNPAGQPIVFDKDGAKVKDADGDINSGEHRKKGTEITVTPVDITKPVAVVCATKVKGSEDKTDGSVRYTVDGDRKVEVVPGVRVTIPDEVSPVTDQNGKPIDNHDIVPASGTTIVVPVKVGDKKVTVDGATEDPTNPGHWTVDGNKPVKVRLLEPTGELVKYVKTEASVTDDAGKVVEPNSRKERGQVIHVKAEGADFVYVVGASPVGPDSPKPNGAGDYTVDGGESVVVEPGAKVVIPKGVLVTDQNGDPVTDGQIVPLDGTTLHLKPEIDGKTVVVDGAQPDGKGGWYIDGKPNPVVVRLVPKDGQPVEYKESEVSVADEAGVKIEPNPKKKKDEKIVITPNDRGVPVAVDGATVEPGSTQPDGTVTYVLDGDKPVVVKLGVKVVVPSGVTVITKDGKMVHNGDILPDGTIIMPIDKDGNPLSPKDNGAAEDNGDDSWTVKAETTPVIILNPAGVPIVYDKSDATVSDSSKKQIEPGEKQPAGAVIHVVPTDPALPVAVVGATKVPNSEKPDGSADYTVDGDRDVEVVPGVKVTVPKGVTVTDQDGKPVHDGDVVPPHTVFTPVDKDGRPVVVDKGADDNGDDTWEVTGDEPVVVGTKPRGDYILTLVCKDKADLKRFEVLCIRNGAEVLLHDKSPILKGDYLIVTPKLDAPGLQASFHVTTSTESVYNAAFALGVDSDVTIRATFYGVYVVPDYGGATTSVSAEGLPQLTVVPNPVRNALRVEGLSSSVEVQVYSPLGVLVQRGVVGPNASLNVQSLQAGYYLLRVCGQTIPFLKQ